VTAQVIDPSLRSFCRANQLLLSFIPEIEAHYASFPWTSPLAFFFGARQIYPKAQTLGWRLGPSLELSVPEQADVLYLFPTTRFEHVKWDDSTGRKKAD